MLATRRLSKEMSRWISLLHKNIQQSFLIHLYIMQSPKIFKSFNIGIWLSVIAIFFLCFSRSVDFVQSIKCYQCSSDEDKSNDSCGAYKALNTTKHMPVDCSGDDAVNPGTFCYKSIQQSPIGYFWDGRWRTVIRRCAQVSDRGISWGCDWGYDLKGVYWEECYCAEDGCNSS